MMTSMVNFWLQIYDGTDTNATIIASFNGSMNPNFTSRYETTGHQMLLDTTTDITVVDRGFVASFEESITKIFLDIHIWEYLLLDTVHLAIYRYPRRALVLTYSLQNYNYSAWIFYV